jgi:hypothetical protein
VNIDPGSGPNNINYLTNANKIALMTQYSAELAMKTQLDTLASAWVVSATAYNNSVAAINTTITGFSGAPANWATIWPDGTTSGPWMGVQTMLSSNWAAIATQRTALQAAISAAQAAAAQATAISTAVAQATANAPVQVASLPTLPNAAYPAGRIVWNTADGYLYVSAGSTWTALTLAAANISGTLTAAQIASLAASQVTGQLSDSQLAAISAAKLTGKITGTQITNGAISTPLLAAGAVTAATIAADTITASQIAAGAITASELAAGAVVAGKIAAGTIQAADIAAATITGANIAATTITAANIAADTITAAQIAAGAITASELAANSVTTAKLVAGAVTAAIIASGAITGDMITAGSLTANVIYFSDGFCLNTLEPKEAGANVTSGHILTATSKPTNTVTVTGIPAVIIGGFAFSVNAASTSDVYNIFGRLAGRQTAGSAGADCYIALYVDGASNTYQDCYFAGGLNTDGMCAFYMSITGLTAGAHTFQFYAHSGNSTTNWTVWNTSTALCQRIF